MAQPAFSFMVHLLSWQTNLGHYSVSAVLCYNPHYHEYALSPKKVLCSSVEG